MSSTGGYDPSKVEPDIYAFWERGGWFHAEPDPSRRAFTIVIPPPNVTGALHLGHAINNTLQDILIRMHRMRGYVACWLPGTDHAGIATQAVVEKRLKKEQGWVRDNKNPEHREFLVSKISEWKDEYEARILGQLRRMGCSCDWPRTRFTLDEQCAKAVYETFFRMFRDGLIYRGTRLVNWDCELQTAVADDELYHETVRGHLWHIRYPICGTGLRPVPGDAGILPAGGAGILPAGSIGVPPVRTDEYLIVATTRPETMLADTAVAVHPADERYKHLIGQRVMLPLTGRTIPIIADDILVKREFGTGVVKVTPGHDPNDYECWKRHPEIGVRNMMTPDGRVHADNAGEGGQYAGLKLEEARKRVVADLEAAGLLEKVEPYETEVGHSDRSKTPIQPYLSEQWFVKMDRLAELAMEAVRDGRVRFFPERYAKTYLDWLSEKRDWCISRQLWWGHRIPVWRVNLRPRGVNPRNPSLFPEVRAEFAAVLKAHAAKIGCAEDIYVTDVPETTYPFACRVCARSKAAIDFLRDIELNPLIPGGPVKPFENVKDAAFNYKYEDIWQKAKGGTFVQDPDVLDTWFSSALWPHSTFGWPESRDEGTKEHRDSGKTSSVPPSLRPSVPALSYFYPTSVLSTARDIITLWVARMVMTGLYNTGRVPFQHVLIHPTIQDAQGRRMSKSLGNGVDPNDLVELYGADAMRFVLAGMAGETQDVRVPVKPVKLPDGREVNSSERFELGRNLCNKLWQAATGFVLPTVRDVEIRRHASGLHTARTVDQMPHFERWIRVRLLDCIREVDAHLARYEFSAAVDALRTFFWSDFCDWYIEEVKGHLRDSGVEADEANDVKVALLQVFDIVLCLMHPVIPFITEKIWQIVGEAIPRHHELIWDDEGPEPCPAQPPPLIVAPWPKAKGRDWLDAVESQRDAANEVDSVLGVVRALREIRASINNLRSAGRQSAVKALPRALVKCGQQLDLLRRYEAVIRRLGQCDALEFGADIAKPRPSASKVLAGAEVYVPLAGLADPEIEIGRLTKERAEATAHIGRIESKLASESFVAKAPPAVVEAERARLQEVRERLAAIEGHLMELSG
ncbi:MAG: valine--tRNA ligase [Phycisphaerae bacterium]|nr:valine--tRNA ligase [Phycisphaerae bacterium]MCZ2400737.1 valine--tRNA ligase [Phycisphaerae bacterium]NUQ49773.1 valine--tRNA ligase [Phycisphaerae bacterium]